MSTDSSNNRSRTVDLASFRVAGYSPGAGVLRRALWYFVNAVVFASFLFPVYGPKRMLLRLFGARIGSGVVIKPRVNIKHPWRLSVGDQSWIGESVWIDNLVEVGIGSNVCISQDAYLLTGNHDYKDPHFGLIVQEITIEDGVWIGARAIVCPGVHVGRGAVVTVGSVLQKNAEPFGIYRGNPAERIRDRVLRDVTASHGQDHIR
jgi:putative colanic acid biosynthesis acetyltransferase WcaF